MRTPALTGLGALVERRAIDLRAPSCACAIALTECCEACAAVEIAGALGARVPAHVEAVVRLGVRVNDVLSRLVR